MHKLSKDKKKKKKTVYYDDGRTIVDMSSLTGRRAPAPKASFKEQMKTYFSTVRAMLLPMLAFMGVITVTFGIVYLILVLAS